MATSVPELITQLSSPDFNARALALAELVRRGKAATPDLAEALQSLDVQLRVQAAQALAEIADPASADVFARMLHDGDDQVRARAAQGLARLQDGRALDALIRTINDFPDVLHYPYTLSIYALIQMGKPALPALASLLKSSDLMTRQRSYLVLRSIVSQLPEGSDWQRLWQSLGHYDPLASDLERNHAAEQWLAWIRAKFS
jgi:HEAT repeat protein